MLTALGHANALSTAAANAAVAANVAITIEADHGAKVAANAASYAAYAAADADNVAALAAYAAAASDAGAAHIAWPGLRADCEILALGSSLDRLPLFETEVLKRDEHEVEPLRLDKKWVFWADWCARALKGCPQNWALLLEIATKDDTFWQGSDDEVNARIADIVERHALASSYAALHVVADTQTKLLRAEVITEIERGFFNIALGRLRDAVDEMRAAPGFANQFTALEPELRRIDDYLARHGDKPLRIYEVAMRTCRLIRAKIEDGQLPEHDPLLEDFQTEVDNTALDILRGDPEVEKVVRQRSAGRFDRLDQAQKEHFRGITPQIIPICEDSLAQELQEEIATATDPEADSQDQAEAMWRWAGLVLRIFRVVRERVHDYAAYVTLANAERGHFISFFL